MKTGISKTRRRQSNLEVQVERKMKVETRCRITGQRIKHFFEVQGILDERRGVMGLG